MLTRVFIAGRSAEAVRQLLGFLKGTPDLQAVPLVITNGHADPLHGTTQTPDVVVLRIEAQQSAELTAWAERAPAARPPLIVVGPAGNAESMRLAMRSGARDFLPEPVNPAELLAAIAHVQKEAARKPTERGTIHAFMSVAGGAGGSLIAGNIAHLLCAHAHRRTALLDLDLNFAAVSHHLNLHPQRSLMAALDEVANLDEHALAGFAAEHPSGLRLFSAVAKNAILSRDVAPDRLSSFVDLLAAHHQHVVIDVPHVIDGLTVTALTMASEITLVLQQSTLHVRNTTRLLRILREELGVPQERVRLLVNRHSRKLALQTEDITSAVSMPVHATIPSHYQAALESSDAGVPLLDSDRTSPMCRSLVEIVDRMTGTRTERASLLHRALPAFLRNST